MIAALRKAFNEQFTLHNYHQLVDDIEATYGHRPTFRVAETPIFVPHALKTRLLEATEQIVDTLLRPDFKSLSEKAIPDRLRVPGETPHTTFLQLDFGICRDEKGELIPQLVELQGFPSLYFWQDLIANMYRKHFQIPATIHHHFNGYTTETYSQLMREVIFGDSRPENVVLLEVEPARQNTAIDFYISRKEIGLEFVCISEVIKEGRDLYYIKDGKKTGIERIYNRIIFDELERRQDLKKGFEMTDDINAQWVGHPNWFFRISKYTMPFLDSPYVPKTHFVSDLKGIPADLDKYVLKPLFSFSGQGVIINPTPADLEAITDPSNYILQRKVEYAGVIETPDIPAKCEMRMMLIWPDHAERPILVNNLIRLSKGEMVGVRYNKDKEWVGASVGFYE